MQILYPEIKPYAEHRLAASDVHDLYVEECGTPEGIAVVFIHGGPGGGCDTDMRRYFDPEKYRIILFDQRGCGRSSPHASLEDNTSQHLIDDLEAIRESLDVEKWMLFGGSWGSTLSLLYAEAHPSRVSAMILRGIFLGRPKDYDWLYKEGASLVYPDYWEDFKNHIPENERGDLIAAYYQRLTGSNELARMAAAKAWSLWEARIATLHTNHKILEHFTVPHVALSIARIEAHYFVNKCFMQEHQLLDNIDKIKDIPGIIVHGRYDMVCTLDNANTLQRAWPISELQIVRDAGHSGGEAGNIDALVRATRTMALRLEDQMLALLQRVTSASVVVDGESIGKIDSGILALIAIERGDSEADAKRLCERLIGYRVFSDDNDKMNLSVKDIAGGLLLVPQFTLAADTQKGMRPSFSKAADPTFSQQLFDYFCHYTSTQYPKLATGRFGADMKVSLCNDGPVTFMLQVTGQ